MPGTDKQRPQKILEMLLIARIIQIIFLKYVHALYNIQLDFLNSSKLQNED